MGRRDSREPYRPQRQPERFREVCWKQPGYRGLVSTPLPARRYGYRADTRPQRGRVPDACRGATRPRLTGPDARHLNTRKANLGSLSTGGDRATRKRHRHCREPACRRRSPGRGRRERRRHESRPFYPGRLDNSFIRYYVLSYISISLRVGASCCDAVPRHGAVETRNRPRSNDRTGGHSVNGEMKN